MVVVDPDQSAAETASERRARLNRRLRQAFVEGTEEDSRRRLGRGLTDEELERVLWHYPGDAVERWGPPRVVGSIRLMGYQAISTSCLCRTGGRRSDQASQHDKDGNRKQPDNDR